MKLNSNNPTSLKDIRTGRTPVPLGLALILALLCMGAITGATAAEGNVPLPQPTIIQRGPHSRLWQTVRQVQVEDQTILTTNSYYELGNGLCFPKDGEYADSQETIKIVNGYGVADQGLHQALFSPSITDSPAVDYQDPSGNRLQSRVLGLAYFDKASGRSAMMVSRNS